MEYLMINESSLKVVCTESDLAPYGISADAIEAASIDSRSFIEGVLDGAMRELGFETKKHRVLIKLFPSADGGCEIFISRLSALQAESDSAKKKEKSDTTEIRLYFFERLEHLLFVCSLLSRNEGSCVSDAFYLDSQGYFLAIECEGALEEYGIDLIDEYSFILEYGERRSAEKYLPMLKEYAKCICRENAVCVLGRI